MFIECERECVCTVIHFFILILLLIIIYVGNVSQ